MLGAASGKLSVTLGSRGRRETKIDRKQARGEEGILGKENSMCKGTEV